MSHSEFQENAYFAEPHVIPIRDLGMFGLSISVYLCVYTVQVGLKNYNIVEKLVNFINPM